MRLDCAGFGRGAQIVEQADLSGQYLSQNPARDREQLGDLRTHQGVDDRRAFPTGDDQVHLAQQGELLRQVRRLDTHLGQHLRHRVIALRQEFQDPDPGRVRQGLEELALAMYSGVLTAHPSPSRTVRGGRHDPDISHMAASSHGCDILPPLANTCQSH